MRQVGLAVPRLHHFLSQGTLLIFVSTRAVGGAREEPDTTNGRK